MSNSREPVQIVEIDMDYCTRTYGTNSNSNATLTATGTGTVATLTFATQATAPYSVGGTITVAGVTPTGFNGTYTVTACTTSSVSYASTATGPQTVAGTVVAPCGAVLGTTGVRKCFNTFATCQSKTNYDGNSLDLTKTTNLKTLRFAAPRVNFPKGIGVYFPVLQNISAISSTVNIAGSDESLSAFGRRATITVSLKDFPYNDRLVDKYQTQRISGAAQSSGTGYDPESLGTFFTKLRNRSPYYVGRNLRIIDGYIDDGTLTNTRTRNFIITNMVGPDSDGNVSFEGKDVLALADDTKAVAPKPSRGTLTVNMTATDTSFTITPTGGGSEYATSGTAVIGSEIVTFTRSGDVFTLTGRGQKGTVAATHTAGDSFQQALAYSAARVDTVIYDLLVNYAGINPAYIDTTAWATEVTDWLLSVSLDTVITAPTGVNTLVGELAVLGVSIWWDSVNNKIGLKANRPLFNDTSYAVSDRNNIKQIEQQDLDQYRLTEVHFYSVQADPTKGVKSKENYNRLTVTIDSDAESKSAYGDTRIREIFCRWLNLGADSIVGLLSTRLLNRFNSAPKTYRITLDAKDRVIGLADVLTVSSRVITDDTGSPVDTTLQVIKLVESQYGHEVEVTAQAYDYNSRIARVMANTANDYTSATALEKSKGGYVGYGTTSVPLNFGDNTPPFAII